MLTNYGEFLFKHYAFEKETGALLLSYAFRDGPEFEEKIVFPRSARVLSADETAALDRAFRLIFLLAGVSYYKTYIPSALRCEAFPLDAATASFLEKVYRNGLGEFAFRNKVSVDLHFVSEEGSAVRAVPLGLPRAHLVPVGGGKDSAVTIECLRKSGEPLTLFAVSSLSGLAAPIRETMERAELPSLVVTRTISSRLMELNKEGALNGHVPITAIISAIAVACAILHGFDSVVFSNEHSASAPNVRLSDLEVNHQYSKSLSFEEDFAAYVHAAIAPDINYFSFLRPLTEAEIARRFAKLETYHSVFRSCNTAFRQDEKQRGKTWCCDCPKCRFVFLALAPFMDKGKLISIFGLNLLNNPAHLEGYKELCGLSAHKPFECVGETEESALLIERLSRMGAWKDDAVVVDLALKIGADPRTFDERFKALFAVHGDHRLAEKYVGMLNC